MIQLLLEQPLLLLVVGVLTLAAALTVVVHVLLRLKPAMTAGLFAGSLTNTPALAGLLEQIAVYAPPDLVEQMLDEPVVGYSIAYPVGVVGMILAVFLPGIVIDGDVAIFGDGTNRRILKSPERLSRQAPWHGCLN